MTTVTQIITDAYRQSNLLALGASPTTPQITEALRYLNRQVKSVFGYEAGEELVAFPIGRKDISRPSGFPWWDTVPDADWFVPKNTRVMLNLEQSLSLYLHPQPSNGSRFGAIDVSSNLATYPVTVYGNGHLIEGATSVVLNTDDTNSEWFYREDQANWVKYSPLIAENTFPFPEEFDDYFITLLAIRLNPSYGIALDPQSEMMFRRSKGQLQARYQQEQIIRSETGITRLSKMAADRDEWAWADSIYDPNAMFNKGWPY